MDQKRRPGKFKNKFTPAEDALLIEIVERVGSDDWTEVARHMDGRNPRQCRERWNNYVNPAIAKVPWTIAEERLLEQKYKEFGSKWHLIAGYFPNRSKNNIKNHWVTYQKKTRKQIPEHVDSVPVVETPNAVVVPLDVDRSILTIGTFEEMTEMVSFQQNFDDELTFDYFF